MDKEFEVQLKLNTLRLKGNLAYEYNPLRNYLTDVNLYKIDNFIIPEGKAINANTGEILSLVDDEWIDKNGMKVTGNIKTINQNSELYASAGSLIDFDTELLNFDLEHPVDIEVQPSYDGSVNLILNDGKNIPRLINSRFSSRGNNTYEIVDRIGENDTNVYSSNKFDSDTSLYFKYKTSPKIKYNKLINGNLLVGLYCFYFTYCDADENESDIICESGLIPAFIGNDRNPSSMDGGIKNQNSNKGIELILNGLDDSYNYLKVYYVRYFADYLQNRVYECKKLYLKFSIKGNNSLTIQITGNEEAESIDANILNISKFNPLNIKTQAQCKNMLFFGNVVKNIDNYQELSDCALRIVPELFKSTLKTVNNDYIALDSGAGYYNTINIYNKTGYFNQEYYRFGVVFIYNDGTLSNVYNTLGGTLSNNSTLECKKELFTKINNFYLRRNYIVSDDDGWIKDDDVQGENLNCRGVCKIDTDESNNEIIGIKFNVSEDVIKYLRDNLNIRGLFFVRQKRVPKLLGQCYLLPMHEHAKCPVLEYTQNDETKYVIESFLSNERKVVQNRNSRLINLSKSDLSQRQYAGICPDFLLNQPFFNQIFNGSLFILLQVSKDGELKNNGGVKYSENPNVSYDTNYSTQEVTICTVTEDVSSVAIKDKIYKLEMGYAEEAWRFESVSDYDNDNEDKNGADKIRGIFSPYLAIYSDSLLKTNALYNIYGINSNNNEQDFLVRMNSSEPFYAISDRYNFLEIKLSNDKYGLSCYRGDCFLNTFTFRLNRNFNDPTLPNNDKIITGNSDTWIDNYLVDGTNNLTNISRSDINAVKLGSWITFKVRSPYNYALRSEDHSYVSEEALMGSPRSFIPRKWDMSSGEHKLPDSYLYNDAYRATLGFKCYFAQQNVNYIKNSFTNRIQYSEIAIQDSYKNNYRSSLSTYYRDYSIEYGALTKLVSFEGYLLVIFEHAIGIAVVNERVLAGSGDGEPVFINTKNVLPEELTVITDTYGTQWPESVIKSEAGYVYGVDSIAKKIWRVKGQTLEILSDFKVNKFLVDNITLGERELTPIIGIRNIKTHYNNNKKDIMFTFYDTYYGMEEKVWNLCFNEDLKLFLTFYSWVPSYSANIDNLYFSFNRDTSKALSSLLKFNYYIPTNVGIVYMPILKKGGRLGNQYYHTFLYYRKKVFNKDTVLNKDGTTYNLGDEYLLIEENITFELLPDLYGNYKLLKIDYNNRLDNYNSSYLLELLEELNLLIIDKGLMYLNVRVLQEGLEIDRGQILVTTQEYLDTQTTDFYLHGQAGIFNIKEDFKPTYWYDKQHPFEFEFVVNDKIGQLKIFTDLVLISNKAEPESFHFEIEGDNYDFSLDKRNMYVRQEATKELYLNLGSDITYDRDYKKSFSYQDNGNSGYANNENNYRANNSEYVSNYSKMDRVYPIYSEGLVQQVKSSIFPLYYERINTYDNIYHSYHLMKAENSYDFSNLSGSEILWNKDLNQFNVVTHIKNKPIDLFGRLRGNSRYKEGKWNIQIPSIVFNLKNEFLWEIPPIVINSQYVPKDLDRTNVTYEDLPNIYSGRKNNPDEDVDYSIDELRKYIDVSSWTYRKEARIRDKWIKVRVRYSGKNLAVIHSLITLYNISYS